MSINLILYKSEKWSNVHSFQWKLQHQQRNVKTICTEELCLHQLQPTSNSTSDWRKPVFMTGSDYPINKLDRNQKQLFWFNTSWLEQSLQRNKNLDQKHKNRLGSVEGFHSAQKRMYPATKLLKEIWNICFKTRISFIWLLDKLHSSIK